MTRKEAIKIIKKDKLDFYSNPHWAPREYGHGEIVIREIGKSKQPIQADYERWKEQVEKLKKTWAVFGTSDCISEPRNEECFSFFLTEEEALDVFIELLRTKKSVYWMNIYLDNKHKPFFYLKNTIFNILRINGAFKRKCFQEFRTWDIRNSW